MRRVINVVDLFAGPGGLGEGFSRFSASKKHNPYKIRISVEKEASAHRTLTGRAFFRLLDGIKARQDYALYAAGLLPWEELVRLHQDEWVEALEETLGSPRALGEDNEVIHRKLKALKRKHSGEEWLIIGGPPCQAYSLVGRSRNRGIKGYKAESDHRHFLYREYLEVLALMEPAAFVMENVKGILSSRVGGNKIFPQILEDLGCPSRALGKRAGTRYKIYSFAAPEVDGSKSADGSHFVIRSEAFGIPQARHRVILLGVREDVQREPMALQPASPVPIGRALEGLPALRSRISRQPDDPDQWADSIRRALQPSITELMSGGHSALADELKKEMGRLRTAAPNSSTKYGTFKEKADAGQRVLEWVTEGSFDSVLNHEARGHMPEDLARYLFCATWAKNSKSSGSPAPKASDFPSLLAPKHKNWHTGKFADRFRVHPKHLPARTITSHISKDGHYYIHFDPSQCRSFTVREAARLQTFPDNYLFEGTRTEQYVQVGNAVPPLLAVQLAEIVWGILK